MKWNLVKKINEKDLEQFPEVNPVILQLLFNRDLKTQVQIDEFLQPDYSQDIYDPYLFNNMNKAVDRIVKAYKNKEKICIFGDYDVDGVCASAILASVFKNFGIDHFSYIPHRDKEGYGLNMLAMDEIKSKKTDLIVTVDCGVSNAAEIKQAKKMSIDTIIVDHHDVPEDLPSDVIAIIHCRLPKENYPFKMLSGGGTAFKLAQALLRAKEFKLDSKDIEVKEKWLLDLVALSTIGDMMTLVGENRTLVKYGLVVLQKTKRLGLQKLYEGAGIDPSKIDTRIVGWQINPRINAAGRLEHANLAYQLLIADNVEQAIMMAHLLNKSNEARQKATETSVREALKQIQESYKEDIPKKALIVKSDNWAAGIVGLVAGRLARKYYRPAYAITKVGDKYTGSGRGIDNFDVTEALRATAKNLIKYGGHVGACGFSLEFDKFEDFKKDLEEYSNKQLAHRKLEPSLKIEAKIGLKDFTWELFEAVEKFMPFGQGNEEPNFLFEDLLVKDWQTVGNDNKHLRLFFHKDGINRKAIAFGLGAWAKDLILDAKVDIVCKISVNEWNGNRELQLIVQDMKIK